MFTRLNLKNALISNGNRKAIKGKSYLSLILFSYIFLCFFKNLSAQDSCSAPEVWCTNITENSVKFIWNYDADMLPYQIRINGGEWQSPNINAASHTVTNISLGDEVNAEVRTAPCPDFIGTSSCSATDCPLITVSYETEPIQCYGTSTGALQVNPTAGTPPFDFTYNDITNQTGYFDNLPFGPKSIWIKDANGCTVNVNAYFFQPNEIEIETEVLQHLSCDNTEATAQVSINAGGIGDLSYEWSNGSTESTLTTSASGIYTVNVSDQNGCMASAEIEIEDHNLPNLELIGSEFVCFDAKDAYLTVNADESNINLDYHWSENEGTIDGATVQGLPAGLYSVTVSNNYGCTEVLTSQIEESPEIILTTEVTPATCGLDNGIATVQSTGMGQVNYQWNDPANQSTAQIDNLPSGNYEVTATNAQACSNTTSVTIDATPEVSLQISSEATTCFGSEDGIAKVDVLTGTAPFDISWSDNSTSVVLTDKSAGSYEVTVTDAYNCVSVQSVEIRSPEKVQVNSSYYAPLCAASNDGEIILSGSGGTGELFYSINGAMDIQNNFQNLSEGTYLVQIFDENNCTSEEEVIVLDAPSPIEILGEANLDANYGSVVTPDFEISGGTGTYNVEWQNVGSSQNTLSCIDCLSPQIEAKNLGEFFLSVIDENGCTAEKSFTLNVNSGESIFIPNAFSPNGDLFNDIFKPEGNDYTYIEYFRVFSEKGHLIFEERDVLLSDVEGWAGDFRGETSATGVYAYVISAKTPIGNKKQLKGEISLFR